MQKFLIFYAKLQTGLSLFRFVHLWTIGWGWLGRGGGIGCEGSDLLFQSADLRLEDFDLGMQFQECLYDSLLPGFENQLCLPDVHESPNSGGLNESTCLSQCWIFLLAENLSVVPNYRRGEHKKISLGMCGVLPPW